jgi:hypothetical protein
MRFSLKILSTILHSFGSRKIQSSSRNTHLPKIFARRDPRGAARSAARLRATTSAGRIRNGHTGSARRGSAGLVHGASARRNVSRGGRQRHLQRCNDVIRPPPRTQPQLPGAYVLEPSFVVPDVPKTDDPHLFALLQDQLFFEALYAGRQVLLRAADERQEKAEERKRAEDAEYARLLEQDMYKAREADRRAKDAEYVRQLEEDEKKARAAQRKAEEEERARLLEEDRRKAQEAHRRAEAREAERRERERLEEDRRRRAEQEESTARARREQERRDRENLYQKAMAETAQSHLVERLRVYEETWAILRSNVAGMEPLGFCDIPWPVFGNVGRGSDLTEERVREFVCHPLQEYIRSLSGGQAKSIRSEMLRWHPDKFEGKVLNRVVEVDREAVREAAGHVTRILTQLSAGMR